jgi:hypothetical protein
MVFLAGCSKSPPVAFSLRSEAQRENNALRDSRHSRGFSVRQESCEGRTASRSASLAAALLDGLFEHPARGRKALLLYEKQGLSY